MPRTITKRAHTAARKADRRARKDARNTDRHVKALMIRRAEIGDETSVLHTIHNLNCANRRAPTTAEILAGCTYHGAKIAARALRRLRLAGRVYPSGGRWYVNTNVRKARAS